MALPVPLVPLDDACSTIFNNTLYSYSPRAFQQLPLTHSAQWSLLPQGVPVTGGVCVQSTPSNTSSSPAALYIVGGVANSSQTSYQGLQRYVFSQGTWETVSPAASVAENRLYHGATYLNSSSSILIYAGNQDGTMHPSSQTFTISTQEPYVVLAYESSAPPAISPLLIPWSESKAAMVGGDVSNTKVMLFDAVTAWEDSNATLAHGLQSASAVKATILTGDDGSKHLFTLDMTVSPNSVNRTVLIGGDGTPVLNAAPVLSRSLHRRGADDASMSLEGENRIDVTAADWPPYNSTLAPTSTRSTYSIANDDTGLIVISGGNQHDVLCMFKATGNSWLNATRQLAAGASQVPLNQPTNASTASQSATQTPTSAATQSATSATASTATTDDANPNRATSLKVLGIVLGVIAGLAIVLAIVMLLFRRRRARRAHTEAGHQRRSSGIPSVEKEMELDRSLHYPSTRHMQQDSQASYSSMAILMGKMNTQPAGIVGRGNGSNASNTSSVYKRDYKSTISKPIPQQTSVQSHIMDTEKEIIATDSTVVPQARPQVPHRARKGSARRSSGWNKYWSGGSATQIDAHGTQRATVESNLSGASEYPSTRVASNMSQPSAAPAPLHLNAPERLSRVASASPTISHPSDGFPLKEGMQGQIERSGSISSISSFGAATDVNVDSQTPNEIPFSSWNAINGHGGPATARVPSSAYTDSLYAATGPRSTLAGSPRHDIPRSCERKAMPMAAPANTDMSWLNLGADSTRT